MKGKIELHTKPVEKQNSLNWYRHVAINHSCHDQGIDHNKHQNGINAHSI